MNKTFCFSNQKGGVGKTTTAINLAAILALRGTRTLLIDLDPQGNSTSGLGIDNTHLSSTTYDVILEKHSIDETMVPSPISDLYVVPSNANLAAAEIDLIDVMAREFVLRNCLGKMKDNFDCVLIDCPPSLGLLTINALAASDRLIIPLQCEYYALEGLGQLMGTFQLVKQKLNTNLEIGGVLLTMADFRTNLTQQVIEEVKKFFGEKIFQSIIPRSVKVSEAPSFGKPIVQYDPSCKGSKAYEAAANEFMERFGFKNVAANGVDEVKETKDAQEGGASNEQAPEEEKISA